MLAPLRFFLLCALCAVASAQCTISASVVPSEVTPKFVNAPSFATWSLKLHPSIVSGGSTCFSGGFSVTVQWVNTDLQRTPGIPVAITGFSSPCTAVAQSISLGSAANTNKQVIVFSKCSNTAQIGTVSLSFKLYSRPVNTQSFPTVTLGSTGSGTFQHQVRVTWQPTGSPTVVGDPVISGFNGQRFGFGGVVGNVYHVYSDPFVSVNALFGSANPSTKSPSTVMDTLFVRYGVNHTLLFSAWGRNSLSRELAVEVDGRQVVLRAAHNSSLSKCTWIAWDGDHLYLALGDWHHLLTFSIGSRAKLHLNTSYVNVQVDVPVNDPSSIGGLIGWTALDHPAIKAAEDFSWVLIPPPPERLVSTTSLTSLDSRTNKFKAQAIECSTPIIARRTAHMMHDS